MSPRSHAGPCASYDARCHANKLEHTPAKTSESTNVNASENVRSSVMQDVTFYYFTIALSLFLQWCLGLVIKNPLFLEFQYIHPTDIDVLFLCFCIFFGSPQVQLIASAWIQPKPVRWLPERFRSQESTTGLCERVPGQFAGACCHHLLDVGVSAFSFGEVPLGASYLWLLTCFEMMANAWRRTGDGAVQGRLSDFLSKWTARWPLKSSIPIWSN